MRTPQLPEIPAKPPRSPATNTPNRRPPSGARPGSGVRPAVPRRSVEVSSDDGSPEPSAPRRAPRAAAQPRSNATLYIAAGSVVALLLFALIGYAPFMRYLSTRALDGAETLEQRKQAAQTLYERRDGAAFGIFTARLNSADALTRDASAYGLSLIALDLNASGLAATEELATAAKNADESGKLVFAPLLGLIAEKAAEKISAKKEGWEAFQKYPDASATALLPDVKNPSAAVRLKIVESLSKVRAPGVCIALLDVAGHDADAAIKSKAVEGLPATALPDAVGALLKAVNSTDTNLTKTARNAFVRVRDEAKSADLLPALDDPNDGVRLEIVAALGRRKGDYKAAEAMLKALKDTSAEIRKTALKSIPATGMSGSALQILPLFSDADVAVRVAAAQALGDLRDPDAHKTLLQAFATNPEGATLDALLAALQKHNTTKDIQSIAVVMEQIGKHPESFKSMSEALVALTNAQTGPKRDAERRQWTLERWNKWWENLSAREKLKGEAVAKLQKADARKQETKKAYPELLKLTIEGLDMLEKCQAMCQPDDLEDVKDFENLLFLYQRKKVLFFKHQELDRGKL